MPRQLLWQIDPLKSVKADLLVAGAFSLVVSGDDGCCKQPHAHFCSQSAAICPGGSTRQPKSESTHGEVHAMSLISLVITLIVVGVLLWLINNYIPMDAKIKSILNIVVVVVVVLWLLNILGLMDSLRSIRVGR